VIDDAAFRNVAKNGSISLKKLPLPFFGTYTVRVSSQAGTGNYKLTVKAKTPKPKVVPGLPVANAGPNRVAAPGTMVVLNGTGTAGATFRWEQVSGDGVALSNGASAVTSFDAPDDRGTLAFQLVATNGGVSSPASTVVVETDNPPIADGGPSLLVGPGGQVTLDGGDSFDLDPEDTTLSYLWEQVSGPAVTIPDPTAESITFDAPGAVGTVVLSLTVSDGIADSVADRVLVEVGGTGPVADAGRPQIVGAQDSVFLSALRSTADPGAAFAWTRSGGANVTLAGADRAVASFGSPRQAGNHTFRVTVDGGTFDETLVVVVRGSTNRSPSAIAGPTQSVAANGALTITGTPSADPDGDPLTYEWLQVAGDPAFVGGDDGDRSGNAGPLDSVDRFYLAVHDGRRYGAPDQTSVAVGNAPLPIAEAGPLRSGDPGQTITLTDGGSTPSSGGSSIATRQWTQVSGKDFYDVAAKDAGFDPTSASPSFTVPTGLASLTPTRTILFELVVTDDLGRTSGPDPVAVLFTNLPANAAPEVSAGVSAAVVRPATLVTLTGTATDGDGDPLDIRWRQTSGTLVTLNNPDSLTASFTAPSASGVLEFELSADDGTGEANAVGSDRVTVSVNSPPTIVTSVNPPFGPMGTAVTLDGTGTTDPESDTLTYEWTELPHPQGPSLPPTPSIQAGFAVIPYTGSIAVRTRTYRLTVTDAVGPTSADVTFVPNAPPVMNSVTASKQKIRYNGADAATLTGNGTDPDGDPLTYNWMIMLTPSLNNAGGTLTPGAGATASFTVAKPTATAAETGGIWGPGATCTDGIQTSASAAMVNVLAYPSWSNDVYSVISANCTNFGCHGSSPGGGGLLMNSASTAYTNLFGTGSTGSSKNRVTANNLNQSYLWDQISSGNMPKNAGALPTHIQNLIRDWILPDRGAGSGLSTGAENN
jgi:hypothetical protein